MNFAENLHQMAAEWRTFADLCKCEEAREAYLRWADMFDRWAREAGIDYFDITRSVSEGF